MKGIMNSHAPYHAPVTAFLCIVVVIAGGLLMVPVSAHPPSGMSVTYQEPKELLVSITHAVPNPGEHYINEVTISVNGKVVNTSRYTSQPSADTFSYTYPVEAVTGDEIKVTATCSLAGSMTRTLHNTGPIASASSASPDSQPTQKAAAGLLPVLGVAAALLIGKK